MQPKIIIALSMIFLIWLTSASARTYRWVDENGVTIYSQSPPPSGEATVIKPPPPPASEPGETMEKLKARLDAMDKAKEDENKAKGKEDSAAKSAEIKMKNCDTAKNNLATLEQNPRVKMKMDDGEYKILPDEERTAEIEKAKQQIEKYCN